MKNAGIYCIISLVLASLLPPLTSNSAQEGVCLYFFYGAGCPECAKVELQSSQLGLANPARLVPRKASTVPVPEGEDKGVHGSAEEALSADKQVMTP